MMAAPDHLGEQFMYHASPSWNRHGIAEQGLRTEFEQGEGSSPIGIFLSPRPSESEYDDVWHVDTSGYKLEEDDSVQMREFQDVGGSWFVPHDIPADRVRLHRKASKQRADLG